VSRGVGERTRRAASAEGLPLALQAGGSARASLAGAHANGGRAIEGREDARKARDWIDSRNDRGDSSHDARAHIPMEGCSIGR
jgi:hypothetical protein